MYYDFIVSVIFFVLMFISTAIFISCCIVKIQDIKQWRKDRTHKNFDDAMKDIEDFYNWRLY